MQVAGVLQSPALKILLFFLAGFSKSSFTQVALRDYCSLLQGAI